MKVPSSLRKWFIAHFVTDMIFAIPMFLAPVWVSGLLGIEDENTLTIRLIGAALFAIGGTSLSVHKSGVEVFRAMLKLKIIWSAFAILAIMISLLSEFSTTLLAILIVFGIFSTTWLYYLDRIGR
ncbi:hypothetical protein HN358_03230 [Candidatus Uhrbacteria bacterium]|jgi:hypothetical protein|nr:hypothetical protein [Candidatus Uhrbacteria bacterium]MBT7717632.1 hypothetical protein [Candidatus Uhrbacteria bacterium]